MNQIAKYHDRASRREYQYSKRSSDARTYAPALQMEMKRRIRNTLRNANKKNRARSKSRIMSQKGDPSMVVFRPDPATRKMLNCMRENNFKGIIEHMNTVDQEDYSAIVDFCKCLETAVSIMRIKADNLIQKITFEDYQQGLLDIMRAAGELADNPKSVSRRHDLENGLNALLRRLESHAALTEILEEHGETEEDLDKRISASLLKF